MNPKLATVPANIGVCIGPGMDLLVRVNEAEGMLLYIGIASLALGVLSLGIGLLTT